jgi:hypothetical protein
VWGEKKGVLRTNSVTIFMTNGQFWIPFYPKSNPFSLLFRSSASITWFKMVDKTKHDMDIVLWLWQTKLNDTSANTRDNPVLHLFLEDGVEGKKQNKTDCQYN